METDKQANLAATPLMVVEANAFMIHLEVAMVARKIMIEKEKEEEAVTLTSTAAILIKTNGQY